MRIPSFAPGLRVLTVQVFLRSTATHANQQPFGTVGLPVTIRRFVHAMNLVHAFRLFMQETDDLTLALRVVSEPRQYFGPDEQPADPAAPQRPQAVAGTATDEHPPPDDPLAFSARLRRPAAGHVSTITGNVRSIA
jgi:hypothetical protein